MHVDKSKNPSFNGVCYINTVTDIANNSVVKAFEKNKDYDLYLRKNGNITERKVERADFINANPWIILCERVKLVPKSVQRYFEHFINKKGEF